MRMLMVTSGIASANDARHSQVGGHPGMRQPLKEGAQVALLRRQSQQRPLEEQPSNQQRQAEDEQELQKLGGLCRRDQNRPRPAQITNATTVGATSPVASTRAACQVPALRLRPATSQISRPSGPRMITTGIQKINPWRLFDRAR